VAAIKAGAISLNAAASVASLPVEEQVAAAVAGKEELKQAAKRVREARRKPAVDPGPDSPPRATQSDDPVESLRLQVAALEAENTALRQQVAHLQAQLQGQQAAAPAGPAPWED
jgi:hypothetical protein